MAKRYLVDEDQYSGQVAMVCKYGKKWIVKLENGKVTFAGKTRVSCFRYAYENGIAIAAYQHGGE